MTRHASPRTPLARRALAALATAGAALGAGAATAAAVPAGAAPPPSAVVGDGDPRAGLTTAAGAVRHAVGPAAALRPNPLAGTGVDPFTNGVGTQVADFKPLDSRMVTDPVTQARSFGDVPVVDRAVGLLGG